MKGFKFREAQRTACCRVCDETIQRGEMVFYTYSRRNRGQSILICMSCINDIADQRPQPTTQGER